MAANPRLRTLVCEPSPANPRPRTLACEPSPANPRLRTLAREPSPANPRLRTLAREPSPAMAELSTPVSRGHGPLLREKFEKHDVPQLTPHSTAPNSPPATPLPITTSHGGSFQNIRATSATRARAKSCGP